MTDYAPEYASKERVRIILGFLALALTLVLVLEYWGFPQFTDYAKRAHCSDFGLFTGTHVIVYGLFIGLPLASALLLLEMSGKRSVNIMRVGQNPLPGEKVLQPTKYKHGWRAKVSPTVFFVIVIYLFGLSIQGYFWASEIIGETTTKTLATCADA